MKLPASGPIGCPVLAAALLRMLLLVVVLLRSGTAVLVSGDTLSYLEPGRSLLLQGVFSTAGQPEIGRTPGYAIFLALATLGGVTGAAFLQLLVSLLAVVLVARLAQAAGLSQKTAVWAAWFMALDPVTTIYSIRLLSETLFCVLLLLAMEQLLVGLRQEQLRPVAVSACAVAAAVFVRPAAYLLPFAWAVGIVLVGCLRRQKLSRQSLRASLLLLAIVMPLLGAWQLRNWLETGFAGFSTIAVRNAYFYAAAGTQAEVDGVSLAEEQQRFGYPDDAAYIQQHPEQRAWSEAERIRFMRSEANRVLRAHPGLFLRAQLRGSAVVALSPTVAELLQMLRLGAEASPPRIVQRGPVASYLQVVARDPLRAQIMAGFSLWLLILYGLAARALWQQRLPNSAQAFLLGTALYFLLVSGGVQAVGRYRLPVMPALCVLAAAGAASGSQRTRSARPSVAQSG